MPPSLTPDAFGSPLLQHYLGSLYVSTIVATCSSAAWLALQWVKVPPAPI
jgi:hypothetical protein